MSGGSWFFWVIIGAILIAGIIAFALLRKRARNRRHRESDEIDLTLDDWHQPTPEDPISTHLRHLGDETASKQALSQSPPRENIQPQPRREDSEDHYQPRRRYGDDPLVPGFVADQESTPRHEPTRHEIPDTPVESPSPTPPPSGGGWGGGHGNDGGSHGGGGGGTVSSGGGDSGGSGGGDS